MMVTNDIGIGVIALAWIEIVTKWLHIQSGRHKMTVELICNSSGRFMVSIQKGNKKPSRTWEVHFMQNGAYDEAHLNGIITVRRQMSYLMKKKEAIDKDKCQLGNYSQLYQSMKIACNNDESTSFGSTIDMMKLFKLKNVWRKINCNSFESSSGK